MLNEGGGALLFLTGVSGDRSGEGVEFVAGLLFTGR